MLKFSLSLLRPYWAWLAIVIVSMLLETAMSLASPWPLKIVLDYVLEPHALPAWAAGLLGQNPGPMRLLNIAAGATIVIALVQGGSAYLTAFYTVSIGQWIAHDLRQSVYAHLQRLSMSYYDRNQVGPIISTITDDINAVQDFTSTSMLDLAIDALTVVGMLVIMFSLNWRFTLIALALTPVLILSPCACAPPFATPSTSSAAARVKSSRSCRRASAPFASLRRSRKAPSSASVLKRKAKKASPRRCTLAGCGLCSGRSRRA